MKRILPIFASFIFIATALIADSIENTSAPLLGAILWLVAMVIAVFSVYWAAARTVVSPVICIVGLLPFFNILLVPLVTFILAFLPDKKANIDHKKPTTKRAVKPRSAKTK